MADELNTVLRNKRLFKICEAVALGLKRYYMAPNKPSTITPDERALAKAYLEHLPRGWMQNGDNGNVSSVRLHTNGNGFLF